MGNSLHSGEGIRQTVEYLRDGVIGRVEEAHTWVPAQRWNPGVQGIPESPVLSGEDIGWDFWLGPTPFMQLHEEYVPVAWRDFWALGCGELGDFGCHDLDPALWAYNLHTPSRVQVLPAGYSNETNAPYWENG